MLKEKGTKLHLLLLVTVAAVLLWSLIHPHGYLIWTMEALPAIVALIFLLATYNRFRLTTLSYFIIALLSIMTFIGAHYTYTKVPFFNWLKNHFDLHRNHYDRFGHFLKGLLAIVLREITIRKTPLTKGPWLTVITLSYILAISALYEIIEWLASIISKGGKASEEFLGSQGDRWDAQWDMSLTFLGAILALLFLSKLQNKQIRKID